MKRSSKATADLRGGAAWIACGLAIVVGSASMDRFEKMGATIYTIPGLVPGMIGVTLMLLGAALALRAWRSPLVGDGEAAAPPLLNGRVARLLALTLGYAVGLVGRLPFWLATALFVSLAIMVFVPPQSSRWTRWGLPLLVGVLTSAVVTLVFERLFLVRLP